MADLRVATVVYVMLAGTLISAWLPISGHLLDHPELVEPGTDSAFFESQRLRSRLGVAVDAVAVLVALVAPIPALGLWTLSLVFFATTTNGVLKVPRPGRRRPRVLKEGRAS